MKRAVPLQKIIVETQEILPPELWPGILKYLGAWHRFRYVTVCKAWSDVKGYLDQSIVRLSRKERRPIDLSGVINLTHLSTTYTSYIADLIRGGQLNKLHHLETSSLTFIGTDMKAISLLGNLKSLKLMLEYGDIQLRGLPYLSGLTSLELECANSTLSIPASFFLTSSETLTELILDGVNTDDDILLSMTRLTLLELRCCLLKEAKKSIAHLTGLRSLVIHGDRVSESGMLSRLTNLTSLDLSYNDVIRDRDITHLTSLVSLTLNANSSITDRVLPSFPLLTELILFRSNFGKNGLVNTGYMHHLTNLKYLKTLRFSCRGIDTHLISEQLGMMRGLTSLHIHDSANQDLSPIFSLSHLTTLQISSFECVNLKGLPLSLRKLDLSECNSCANVINVLSTHLTNLTELVFGYMHMSFPDMLAEHWSNIKLLTKLERIFHRDAIFGSSKKLQRLPNRVELIRY